nr:Chain A, TuSp1 [Trichonephila antipodiana]
SGNYLGVSQNFGRIAPVTGGTAGISVGVPGYLRTPSSTILAPSNAQIISLGLQTTLAPVLSSSGLSSASASARVSSLAQSLASALSTSRGTLSLSTFLNLLSSISSEIRASTSLDGTQATVEVLLEALAALLQVINGAQITDVNVSSVPSVNAALVSALVA